MNPYHHIATAAPSRAEAERWLAIAEKLLAGRDLVGSKTFAIRARESDPRLEGADQILAVADTLLASEKRINGSFPDWYSLLQLPPLCTDLDLMATHYRRLAILLNPNATRLCFADHAFQLVSDAWSVLSNPGRKSQYDYEITFSSAPVAPPVVVPPQQEYVSFNNGISIREEQETPYYNHTTSQGTTQGNQNQNQNPSFDKSSQQNASNGVNEATFWTACPYCYNMYEYPGIYEECTMRCQNCRRAFHGAKIAAPPDGAEGDGGNYTTWAFYPLGVEMTMMEKNKGGVGKWNPFSPMFSCPASGGEEEVKRKGRGQPKGPRVYIDDDEDDDDDLFMDESEDSEGSDDEWGSSRKKKKKSGGRRGRPRRKQGGDNVKSADGGAVDEALHVGTVAEEGGVVLQNGVKSGVGLGKKQVGKVPKDWGKLDLNVEFSNEGEEAAPGVAREGKGRQANGEGSKPVHGEEDGGIEGIGFFEGLDEFLSSLPILNVVDDKVKAA